MSASQGEAVAPLSEEGVVSRSDRRSAIAGAAVLALTVAICVAIPSSLAHFRRISPDSLYTQDGFYKQEILRLDATRVGILVAAFLLVPAMDAGHRRLRQFWRDSYTYWALAGVCAFIGFFVVHFGRWQFGAWDFPIVIDTGWRQVLGQIPYVDFPTTTAPGFNLGIKYSFELFGVNWDANLYFSAIFTCATLLWMYWLMTQLPMGRLASLATAFAIECAGMLTICYWWYNDCALILAAVFFLACLAYARNPWPAGVQVSYLAALTLFSLMKPNMAGLMIAGGVLLLFFATGRKMRLATLTLGAVVAALAILALNHVPVGAMLRSYLSVAKHRGGITEAVGYLLLPEFERHTSLFWVGVLSLPLLGAIPAMIKQVQQRDWRRIAFTLLFPFCLVVAIYGILTNGEFMDLECTALLAAGGVIAFGLRWDGRLLRRVSIAILCASMAGDLYYGAARVRVHMIGLHLFFEWQDNQYRFDSGFLENMRVGAPMVEMEREVKQALDASPGPYFLGPRLDFNYAAFGIPSPKGFPAWCPGTAFPVSDEGKIIRGWQQDHFQTLIFVKVGFLGTVEDDAYPYYPKEFRDIIDREYVRDDNSYPDITVYRLRGPADPAIAIWPD